MTQSKDEREPRPAGRPASPDTSPQAGDDPVGPPIHVSFLVDRSGSMRPLRSAAVEGFNGFVAEHRAGSGECALTLVQFDSQDPFEVIHEAVPVREVPDLTAAQYQPRAGTPLLDALGRLIEQADARLKRLDHEEDQIVAVFTDGLENASRHWDRQRLFEAIAERKERGWTFVFMGANQDSYAEGGRLGFDAGSTQNYRADRAGFRTAWRSLSRATSQYRGSPLHEKMRRKRDFFSGTKEAESGGPGHVPPQDNSARLFDLARGGRLALRYRRIFQLPAPFAAGSAPWSRVRGMMLGLAIGDALGNTSESRPPEERRQRFGEIRDYLPNRHAGGRAVGLPSDDSQLAFWTLEHLIECRGLDPERLARKFCSRPLFGMGRSVAHSLAGVRAGQPWWEAAARSAGNGALMRIAPVVVPHLATAGPGFWNDAALCAAITHNDSGSFGACVAFAAMLGELLACGRPPEPEWWVGRYAEVAEAVEGETRYGPRGGEYVGWSGPIWRFVREHVPVRVARQESALEACNAWLSGAYLLETVPTVLFLLTRYGHDPEEAIVRAVNDTWDNDTIAAIVGAAVGALHGEAALPKRWRSGLLGRTGADDDGRVEELLDAAELLFGR